jgi:hypothetical protein
VTAEAGHRIDVADHPAARVVEAARWHALRYDGLRSSLANRASFVVSVDAVLIAGVSFLFPWIIDRGMFGGKASLALVGLGTMLTLLFAALSISRASRALLSSQSWRTLFGGEPAPSLFYHYSDTVNSMPEFAQFRAGFMEQTRTSEAESAVVCLWLVLLTYGHRYQHLRAATKYLRIATLSFVGAAMCAVVLALVGLLIGKV